MGREIPITSDQLMLRFEDAMRYGNPTLPAWAQDNLEPEEILAHLFN
jgi:hypothetical protein